MRQTYTPGTPHSRPGWLTEIAKLIGSTALCVLMFLRLPDPRWLPIPLFFRLMIPLFACWVLSDRYTLPTLADFGAGLGAVIFWGWFVLFLIQLFVIFPTSPLPNLLLTFFAVLDWLGVTYLALCNLLVLTGLVGALSARLRVSS